MDLFSSSEQENKLSNQTILLLSHSEEVSDVKAAEDRINELRSIISQHDQLYYGQSKAIISDQDYDILFSRLKSLENEYPEFFSEESPTQKLGDVLQEDLKSVKHLKPMLSLDNSYNIDDLNRFDKRVKDGLPDSAQIEYAVELKYDGSSIAIVYENNLLVRGATRGNGVEGDDITENTKVIKGVPLQVDFNKLGIRKIEVRGEVVINLKVFEQLNIDREKDNLILREKGKKEFAL